MIIRLRSRDGLERIQVADGSSVSELQLAIQNQLGVPLEQQQLSQDSALLTAKNGGSIRSVPHSSVAAHGAGCVESDRLHQLQAVVDFAVTFDWQVADIVAKQRRVERQDKPAVEGLSFDRAAANIFQQYCQSALAFSIKRGGILYGTDKDADSVDNDWFLCPVKILDHEGPLLTNFPVENRLVPQTSSDLREQLKKYSGKPYGARLADLHLLLWLAGQHLDQGDMLAIAEAARGKGELLEGYKVIIDSLAGV
eukprot:gene4570-4825_t